MILGLMQSYLLFVGKSVIQADNLSRILESVSGHIGIMLGGT
ncbi:MAG: hypothetical protein N3I35_04255 [Clostridia bacterium]|nr:hypothetical protein [Clostridia bacterium]